VRTVNNVLAVLNMLFRTAVEWNVILEMPCRIRLLKVPRSDRCSHMAMRGARFPRYNGGRRQRHMKSGVCPSWKLDSLSAVKVAALLGLVLLVTAPTVAQHGDELPAWTEAASLTDPSVPLGSVRNYVQACRSEDWNTAAGFLNLAGLPPDERAGRGARIAWQLKVVLDRALPIRYELLSREPEGHADDGLPPGVERLGQVGVTDILLEKPPGQAHWVFSAGTVAAVPDLYAQFGYGALGEFLPAPMFEISVLDLQLWQWTGLLLVAFMAYALAWSASWLARRIARTIVARTESKIDDRLIGELALPFRFLVALGIFNAGASGLALPIRTHDLIGNLSVGATVLIVTWLILRTIDLLSKILQDHLEESDRRSAIAVLPLARRGLKIFLLAVASVALLQNVGFNVTGLLAGLGVGGLAVALAAQKSIANLFGGISLIVDQPIRVGDFCRFGDGKIGTVEEIGLRSTRIRTPDRTLVSIPNGDFSEIQLENYGARDRIRLYAVIGLRYETSADQLRHVLAEMRRLLIAHPMITEEPARVRFVGFGAHSLDLELFAYVGTCDWNEFLQVREDVLLRFMDIVRDSGTGFAFPSQTLYLGRDSGLDEGRTREAEECVRGWRERNELPFPEFPEALVTEIDGTVDYPPRGSATIVEANVEEPTGRSHPSTEP
jgi:MscS family membrane protein